MIHLSHEGEWTHQSAGEGEPVALVRAASRRDALSSRG